MLVNFVFVATFVIKIKQKWQKSDKHFKLVTLTSIVRCAIYAVRTSLPPPPPGPQVVAQYVGWLTVQTSSPGGTGVDPREKIPSDRSDD